MNRALFLKELRALRPYALCILALFCTATIYLLATEMPDDQKYTPEKWLDKSRGGSLAVVALFSILLGAGLLVHESEEGTLYFLDGLPVSRTRVFTIKVLAGFLVLSIAPLCDFGSDLVMGLLSRNSVDPPFAWRFLCAEALLQVLAGAYLLSIAMVVSFTRAWFALVAGLLFWAFLWLRQRGVHWLAFLDTYALIGPAYDKSKVLIAWQHVAAHATATALALVTAWLAFLSLGDRVQYAVERLARLRWLAALGVGLRWLAPIIWIAAFVKLASTSNSPGEGSGSPMGEEAFSERETKHYEFLYRTAQNAAARPLIKAADPVYEKVAGLLGAPATPGRVVVDLASPVVPHASGQTNWTKIRIPLQLTPSQAELRLILGHETAHVFIEQLSEGKLTRHFNEIRCLHEGLATYVELQLFATDEDRAKNRRAVAGACSRGAVPLALLFDDQKLKKEREPNLVYPLGEVLSQALVDTHGREAPARLLRAFARKDAPIGLEGSALWRDTMQAAGLSLDKVSAAYDAACATAVTQEKKFVETLPRLTAAVRFEDQKIVVQPSYTGTAPGKLLCYTEDDDPMAPQMVALDREKDGSFTWPRARQSKPVFRYLLGWRTPGTRLPVFEPWAEAVPQ